LPGLPGQPGTPGTPGSGGDGGSAGSGGGGGGGGGSLAIGGFAYGESGGSNQLADLVRRCVEIARHPKRFDRRTVAYCRNVIAQVKARQRQARAWTR
jgi:hypothetical protein